MGDLYLAHSRNWTSFRSRENGSVRLCATQSRVCALPQSLSGLLCLGGPGGTRTIIDKARCGNWLGGGKKEGMDFKLYEFTVALDTFVLSLLLIRHQHGMRASLYR